MLRSTWVRALLVTSLAALALTLPSSGVSAQPEQPSLRLMSVLKHVQATRFGDNRLFFSPGVYIAATGGAFELDAVKGADGKIALWQVRRDSKGVHPIQQVSTPLPVHFERGVPRFFHLALRNSAGTIVKTLNAPFCPNSGFGPSRADASGPSRPTYPFGCGGTLTQAAVWGIDEGWASPLDMNIPFSGKDGKYSLSITIAPTYVTQFNIPASATRATITLTIKSEVIDKCPPFCVAVDRATNTAPGEGPQIVAAQPAVAAAGPLGHSISGVPDLQSLPAHDLSLEHNKRTNRDYLNFAATVWNAGSGPLIVEGFRPGAAGVMPATQFIYQDGQPTSSKVVGQFEYDTRRGHQHWHMEDFAQYDLLNKAGTRVLLSGKQSFCLAPTDAIDLTLPGAAWQPDQAGLWSACSGGEAIWLRESLPAGWGDTYYQSVAGQSFNITSVPNGHYQIRVNADPFHRLIESDYDNNAGLLPITLGGKLGHRTLKIG